MIPSVPLLSCESSVSVKKTLIEKKISGVSGFSSFLIEHIRKPGNYGNYGKAYFSRYSDYLSDLEHFFRLFVLSGENSQSVSQGFQ